MEKVDYSSEKVPEAYKCSSCRVHGCKLWRQYQTFLSHIKLHCVDCAGKEEGKDVSDVDEKGRIHDESVGRTDSIGWLVPAVPTKEGDTYWGYTSVPREGIEWWCGLPSRSKGRRCSKA
jgi:hypothetical protein